jgi:membrane-associated protease RseP (regulator of RpoE activity)
MSAEDLGPDATAEPASVPPPSEDHAPRPLRWKTSLALFVATVCSVFFTGAVAWGSGLPEGRGLLKFLSAVPRSGAPFAVPLIAILLTHELGHFIAARIHRVDASLPYFIPLPLLSPFGTMGAVINMRGRIRSRDALLDIGASGPLAGLVVAIPVLVYGLMHSHVAPNGEHGTQEGQCLLYMLLKRLIVGPIPPGHDVFLTPTALAGWAGLFVTMLNLIAVAQLDGGHIAYALFGKRQNRYARALHALLLLMFAFNLARFLGPVIVSRPFGELWHALRHDGAFKSDLSQAFGNSLFWLFWYFILRVIMRMGGRDHPPTEPGELSPVRKGVAVLSLVLFVLLFMPTPWATY